MLKESIGKQFEWYVSRRLFWLGLIVGILYAILFYCFLVCCRESLRVLTFLANYNSLITLSTEEAFFHNFFLAFISCLTGFGICTDFWLRNLKTNRLTKLSISVDAKGLQWYFNWWYAKLGVMFGVLSIGIPITDYFQFYSNYWFMFILILFVLFNCQWNTALLIFKKRILDKMIITGVIQISISLTLAFFPPIKSKTVNLVLLKNTPQYTCNFELPKSPISYLTYRHSLNFNLYYGFSPQRKDSLVLAVNKDKIISRLKMDDISKWIQQEGENVFESERGQISFQLFIDKRIPTKMVKDLIMIMRRSGAVILKLMVSNDYGIPWNSRLLCIELQKVSSTGEPLSIDCSSVIAIRSDVKVSIRMRNNGFWINNEKVNDKLILKKLIAAAKEFQNRSVIELFVDDNSTYEYLIKLHSLIRQAYVELWIDEIQKKHGVKMNISDFGPEIDRPSAKEVKYAKEKFPLQFIQWSDEEIEYFKLPKD